MPKSPRRKFNADRFLDKFKCFEGVLGSCGHVAVPARYDAIATNGVED